MIRSFAAIAVACATVVLCTTWLSAPPAVAAEEDPIAALAERLPDKAEAALARIDAGGRRLLALRAYLRSASWLESRWSWTEEEIKAYETSDAHKAALEAVAAVTKAFEEKNDGYSLYVNTQVRSLDAQIASWNRNASVGAAARKLADAYSEWSDKNAEASAGETRGFLLGWEPEEKVAIAVPGVSPHGRARAFDFQIAKGGAIVVPASTKIAEEVWDGEGWTEKLKTAVKDSKMPFKGPLESPYEPWHYDYSGNTEFDPAMALKQPVVPEKAPTPTKRPEAPKA